MAKYHISPTTGNPNKCTASAGGCPFGDSTDHFDTKEAAREAYEERNNALTVPVKHESSVSEEEQARQAAMWASPEGIANIEGLELVNRVTGEVDGYAPISPAELELGPDYIRSIEKGYEDSPWEPRRKFAPAAEADGVYDVDPYCFVCSRNTDHFAEHDGLVEAGLAEYGQDGSVRRTNAWDDERAKQIADQEYMDYLAEIDLSDDPQPTPVQDAFLRPAPMNSYAAEVGDEFNDAKGERYRVTSIVPAGSMGVAHSAGPAVMVAKVREDGSTGAYVRKVQHNAMDEPKDFTTVPKHANGFYEGKTTYPTAVIAFVEKQGFIEEPNDFLKTGKSNMVRVVVPDVARLTDKRRMEIGRKAFELGGRDLARWDNASDEEKLRWTRTHMGRYEDVEVHVKDGKVGWSTSTTSGDGHALDDVQLVKLS